jgi:hypothetical protein
VENAKEMEKEILNAIAMGVPMNRLCENGLRLILLEDQSENEVIDGTLIDDAQDSERNVPVAGSVTTEQFLSERRHERIYEYGD